MKRLLQHIQLPLFVLALGLTACETEPVAIEPEGTGEEEQPLVITFSETNLDVMADTLEDKPRLDSALIINVVENAGAKPENRYLYSITLRNKGNFGRFLDYGQVTFGPLPMNRSMMFGNVRYDLFFESETDYTNRPILVAGSNSDHINNFSQSITLPPFLHIDNISPDSVVNIAINPLKIRLDRLVNPDVLYFSIVPDKQFNGLQKKGKPFLNVRVIRATRGFAIPKNILRQLVAGYDKEITRFFLVVSNQKIRKTDDLVVREKGFLGQQRSVPVYYRNRFVLPVYFSKK